MASPKCPLAPVSALQPLSILCLPFLFLSGVDGNRRNLGISVVLGCSSNHLLHTRCLSDAFQGWKRSRMEGNVRSRRRCFQGRLWSLRSAVQGRLSQNWADARGMLRWGWGNVQSCHRKETLVATQRKAPFDVSPPQRVEFLKSSW